MKFRPKPTATHLKKQARDRSGPVFSVFGPLSARPHRHHGRSGRHSRCCALIALCVGGELAHKAQVRGLDFVIIEGEAARAPFILTSTTKRSRSATPPPWQGTRRSAEVLAKQKRPPKPASAVHSATLPELVPMSNMMVDRATPPGGLGSATARSTSRASSSFDETTGDCHIHADSARNGRGCHPLPPQDPGAHTHAPHRLAQAASYVRVPQPPRAAGRLPARLGAAESAVMLTDLVDRTRTTLNHIGYRNCSLRVLHGPTMWNYTVRQHGLVDAGPIRLLIL